MKRMPELDALRAFAAVVVLLFHLDPLRYFPGWSGVDLFFVLSGFLITSIILRDGDTPGFTRNFYARRSLRIWPIYYLTVLGLIALNPLLSQPAPLAAMPYVLTYTQNLTLYWSSTTPPIHPALDHAWTLAIEEQFYLIWPALVLWAGRKRLVPLCLLMIALALASRTGNNGIWPRFNERLLLARCDGFALGGLLAGGFEPDGWGIRHRGRASLGLGAVVGLALAYFGWGCWQTGPLGFIGLPTPSDPAWTTFAFALLYAGIIGLLALHSGSTWLRPFRFGPLVYLGQISYGLYLYHYGIYWIIDGCRISQPTLITAQPGPTQALKLAASLAVAIGSWHLIERPILRWKDRFRYRAGATR